ncbi:MAG: protein kinase [Gemmatimonadales bacterium]|nr:protein kinase [Gemmatimonadales bacterium]
MALPDLAARRSAEIVCGRYALDTLLGEGASGVVYRARDERLGRYVAVKLLRPDVGAGVDDAHARFLHEVQLASRLHHPHIVTVHDAGEWEGALFCVMALVEGESLRAHLRRSGAVAPALARRWTIQVAEALQHAHDHGIIHRDVKPENILLTRGNAMLADFGIARAFDASPANRLTQQAVVLGTPAYMSPEQALGDEVVDPRSDLYSLACVTWEMLTGRVPHDAPTVRALLVRRATGPAPVLRECAPAATTEFDAALQRALDPDPDQRFTTAAQFAEALAAREVREDAAPRPAPPRGLAVLGLQHRAEDADASWLALGLREALQAELATVAGLAVLAPERVDRALAEAGEERAAVEALHADWLLRGTLQQAGAAVRVTLALSEAPTGQLLGALKVDGRADDAFALQDELARQAGHLVRDRMAATAPATAPTPGTPRAPLPPDAGRRYIEAYRLLAGGDSPDEAVRLLGPVVESHPAHAPARTALAMGMLFQFMRGAGDASLTKAITHLEEAVALDPGSAEAHRWLACARGRAGDMHLARRHAERAVALAPDSAAALFQCAAIAHATVFSAPFDADAATLASELYLRAIRLDPHHAPSMMQLAWLHVLRGAYAVARPLLEQAVEAERATRAAGRPAVGAEVLLGKLHLREGDHAGAESRLRAAYAALATDAAPMAPGFRAIAACTIGDLLAWRGAAEEADAMFEAAAELARAGVPAERVRLRALLGRARAHAATGRLREARQHYGRALAQLGRAQHDDFRWLWEGGVARLHGEVARCAAALGDEEAALHRLELAVECHWGDIALLRLDPGLAALAPTPRIERLLAAANAPAGGS